MNHASLSYNLECIESNEMSENVNQSEEGCDELIRILH